MSRCPLCRRGAWDAVIIEAAWMTMTAGMVAWIVVGMVAILT